MPKVTTNKVSGGNYLQRTFVVLYKVEKHEQPFGKEISTSLAVRKWR